MEVIIIFMFYKNVSFISSDTGEDKDEMLVYRQNNIDTTDYPIYTIWYENLKWKQYDPQISRLNFAGVYSKLTSVEADCTSGNVSITSIYIFTLDGWALWTGSYQNIFTLDMHVGSGSFTYSIKVKETNIYDTPVSVRDSKPTNTNFAN